MGKMKNETERLNLQDNRKKMSFISIRTKLVCMMVAIVIVPLLAVTIISTLISRNSLTRQTVAINEEQANNITQHLKSTIEQNMRSLESLAYSPYTISYLHGDLTELGGEQRLFNQIKKLDDNFDDGGCIAISGTDGMQRLKSTGNLVDVSDREYFKQAMAGNPYISDVQVSKSDNSLIATFAVPVTDQDAEVIGMVQRNYKLDNFRELLQSEVLEDSQDLLIADNNGLIISHSSHEIDANNLEDQSANPYFTDSRGEKLSGDYTTH